MSSRTYSNRRRGGGGMRFKPEKKAKHSFKAGLKARQEAALPEPKEEPVFNPRYETEIRRAENKSAGLPPDTKDEDLLKQTANKGSSNRQRKSSRKKGGKPPEKAQETEAGKEESGFKAGLKKAANKMIERVRKVIRPKERSEIEIIINAESLETRVAILRKGHLEDFNIERTEIERLTGSVFKGRIKNLEDGLKAAFVDIGYDKNAFLHYWDIIPNSLDSGIEIVERDDKKKKKQKNKITQKDIPKLYPPGSEIVVQVTKGPIGTKGPRITTNISIPGRYLVLLPYSDQSGISRKIESNQERQRLKAILKKLSIPEGMGVVMRTAGEGKQLRYFVRDLAILLDEWKEIQEKIKNQKAPSCVFEEPDLIGRTVRDFLTEDIHRIMVDDPNATRRIQEMIEKISKRAISKVKHYADSQAIFDRFNVTRQLENAFSRQVSLKSGGHLVIDETEALVAIDVNTGKHKSSPKDQDSTILNVNLEAADEICRQLRLRNIGGLIVLDFIDMKQRKDQNKVYQAVKEHLKADKAKTHVLPISQLGLIEMTRQRHTESVHSSVYDDCPHCQGRGVLKSALTMSVEIQRKLSEILKRRPRDESDYQLRIAVHPTVLERLRTEDEKLLINMEKKYFGKLSFRADSELHPEQFEIVDVSTNQKLASA